MKQEWICTKCGGRKCRIIVEGEPIVEEPDASLDIVCPFYGDCVPDFKEQQ